MIFAPEFGRRVVFPGYTVKNIRMLINRKTAYDTSINGKRVFELAIYNKPFLRVYYENNERFFRLQHVKRAH